jgi:hypothetical protein
MEMETASQLSGVEPALTAAKSLWEELWGRKRATAQTRMEREVWSPEEREYYRTVMGPQTLETPWYPLATFARRLEAAIAQVQGDQRAPSVFVFQLTEPGADLEPSLSAAELGLGRELRPGDFLTRLSEQTLAVALVSAETGTQEIAARLTRALEKWTGGSVSAGCARYPQDGRTALDLLRKAAGRIQLPE